MTNTLIYVGVLVILLIVALIAYRMSQTDRVRAREHRKLRLLARERALTLHQISKKINAYRPGLDVVGLALADEVAQLIVDHDKKILTENYDQEEDL